MEQELVSRIDRCRSCAEPCIETFFNLGEQALANNYLDSPDALEDRFPLELSFCDNCGLVQLNHTVLPEKLFSHYVWVTGTSSTARKQAEIFQERAMERLPDHRAPTYVLEIASNDGTFLKPFMSAGIDVLGVDPAANIVEQANRSGIETRCAFFCRAVAEEIVAEKGRPNLVIARNVLAHVANLHDFVDGIAFALGDEGVAAIEFHSGAKILQELQYDSIYHEHLCYLTGHSVANLFGQFGLEIFDIDHSPISGGALIVYVKRVNSPVSDAVGRFLESERTIGVDQHCKWKEFACKSQKHRTQLRQLLTAEHAASRRVVGYGASARSSTLLSFCGLGSDFIPMIADQNAMKHGRYTAGTHIPILSPEEVMATNPDSVIVLAWNFFDEIREDLCQNFDFSGHLIAPLPLPAITSIGDVANE